MKKNPQLHNVIRCEGLRGNLFRNCAWNTVENENMLQSLRFALLQVPVALNAVSPQCQKMICHSH